MTAITCSELAFNYRRMPMRVGFPDSGDDSVKAFEAAAAGAPKASTGKGAGSRDDCLIEVKKAAEVPLAPSTDVPMIRQHR
jgi:hypothetical protein